MAEIYTIPQTASRLKIAQITLRRMIKKRAIPFHRVGVKYLFTEDDISSYLETVSFPMTVQCSENAVTETGVQKVDVEN